MPDAAAAAAAAGTACSDTVLVACAVLVTMPSCNHRRHSRSKAESDGVFAPTKGASTGVLPAPAAAAATPLAGAGTGLGATASAAVDSPVRFDQNSRTISYPDRSPPPSPKPASTSCADL